MIVVLKKPAVLLLGIFTVLAFLLLITIPTGVIRTMKSGDYSGTTIVLDAGHGGQDGGCSGADGTLEKDLNLEVTLRLSELFRMSGIRVVLTRSEDRSTDNSIKFNKNKDIRARIDLVKSEKKPLLISVHMNKFSQSQYKGTQIFFGKEGSSKALAEQIQENIKAMLQKDNNRKAKPIPSDVLLFKRVSAPTILCECGFLSNSEDLQNLKNDEYRKKLALILYTSVLQYLSQ